MPVGGIAVMAPIGAAGSGGSSDLIAITPRNTAIQRLSAHTRINATDAITKTVRLMFSRPVRVPMLRKLRTINAPADIVVDVTNAIRTSGTQADLARPVLIRRVVTRQSASTASS